MESNEKFKAETYSIVVEQETKTIHQCQSCFTVYDPLYGDLSAGIEKDTAFEELPETYICSVCEAPKTKFEKAELKLSSWFLLHLDSKKISSKWLKSI